MFEQGQQYIFGNKLKAEIGEDKFDHVFALSIWAHCDENKLADMINFYTDKVCWFEGHNAMTYGDTKSKMDMELERLLDLPYHEYIGETSDRSIRQNYKLSRSLRIDLNNKNDFVYFSGEVFDTVKEANHDYEDKMSGGRHLVGKDSYSEGRYNYNGKYSCYLGESNSDVGWKILNFDPSVTNLEDKYNNVKKVFDIQTKLAEGGFAPKPHQILKCHDSQTFYHAIEMQNIKGKFVQPDDERIEKLVSYCRDNGLTRSGWSVSDDCVPKNCIEMDGKIYLVDIDYKWVDTNA